ncbi:MAG: hypothetical protein LBQ15_09460 [Clostridium sp.]|jgi:hypothetical protein|nr:hypothetical protein [Clostridium sp.]
MSKKLTRKTLLRAVSLALAVGLAAGAGLTAAAATDPSGLFDARYYARTYADVKEALGEGEEDLYGHYLRHGGEEGRSASIFFNARAYREAYPDLYEAFGTDLESYAAHFAAFGLKERRDAGGEFPIARYIDLYPEVLELVGEDPAAIAEYYVTVGETAGQKVELRRPDGSAILSPAPSPGPSHTPPKADEPSVSAPSRQTDITYGESSVSATFLYDRPVEFVSAALTGTGNQPVGGITPEIAAEPRKITVTVPKSHGTGSPLTPGAGYQIQVKTRAAGGGPEVSSKTPFTAITGLFRRPESGSVIYTVQSFDTVTGVAQLISDDSSRWYAVPKTEAAYGIFDAVYTPNRDVTGAAALFHVTVGTESKNDSIALQGTNVPTAQNGSKVYIQVGKPGVDNAAGNARLPGFTIPAGGLGSDGGDYKGTWIVVNSGAYLDIVSDQTWDNAFGQTFSAGTAGKFKNGTVMAAPGGSIRDSAYKAWPLGEGSIITVSAGGKLAVGPGTREGTWADSRLTNGAAETASSYYSGWLIGGKITFDGSEATAGHYIDVAAAGVLLNGAATVNSSVSLMYDVYLTAGSSVTIAQGATLAFLSGTNDNQGSFEGRFYGQPGLTGGKGQGGDTQKPASAVTVNGNIVPKNNQHPFGCNQDSCTIAGTWTANHTTKKESPAFSDRGDFYSSWTADTSE